MLGMGRNVAKKMLSEGRKMLGIAAKITAKSVFEVDDTRLGIGVFNRPLLDDEVRRFRAAWEKAAPAGLEEYELEPRRISFFSEPESMPAAWDRINALLARTTTPSKKVA
jgi:hypothetical protein